MQVLILFAATLFLAYSNGANDNFKGVATLFGSKTTSYRVAIAWATACTFVGSTASVILATTLVKRFSGKGLVPDAIASGGDFHSAIALAAGLTVILATMIGFPISTTHALTGALVGAGLVASLAASQSLVNWSALQNTFILPLLFSPLLAVLISFVVYRVLGFGFKQLGMRPETCVCVTPGSETVLASDGLDLTSTMLPATPALIVDATENCQPYLAQHRGISSQPLLNATHFLSAGMVSFARGLNDTPKIAALILTMQVFSLQINGLVIAIAMAIGGWLNARRVAETMSQKITPLTSEQGLSANLVTALLVIVASRWGLPVSTTHVSVGSIAGVGISTNSIDQKIFGQILLSWLLTLPIAALLSGGIYFLISSPTGIISVSTRS